MSDGGAAREALRQRQGPGVRYDAAMAPHRELAWARLGTAYFARLLNDLSDHDLDVPVEREGWSRRHVVAFISYQARKMADALAWARTGGRGPLPFAWTVAAHEIDLGVTLPAEALRHLFRHAEVHLNVEWRDLTDEQWEASVRDGDGAGLALRATPVIRARALWCSAMDLNSGGRFADIPTDFHKMLEPSNSVGI